MDDFNAAAGDNRPPCLSLLEGLQKLRKDLALTAAAKRQDWQACAELSAEGASLERRNNAALKEITSHCTQDVVTLLEKLETPELPNLAIRLLAPAAAEGKRDIVEHLLQKNPGPGYLNSALFDAIRKDQKDISDLLFERLGAKNVGEDTLFFMQVNRPDLYDQVAAVRPWPQDYTWFFINACALNDHAAMDRALDAMIKEAEAVKTRLGFHEDVMMGFGYQEAFIQLFQTGDLPIINKFLDHFLDSMKEYFPSPQMMMMIALSTAPDNADVLSCLIDRFQADDKLIGFALSYAAQMRRMPVVERLMEAYPDIARTQGPAILGALAAAGRDKEFLAARQDGYALPEEDNRRADLLAKAITAKSPAIVAHLEAAITITPGIIAALQSHHDTNVLTRAAELGGDWRFRDDTLFWRALEENIPGILAHFPADEPVALTSKYTVMSALEEVIQRGDMAQLGDVLKRGTWEGEFLETAFKCCLASPEAVKNISLLDYPVRELTPEDLRAVNIEKGVETLRALAGLGFTLSAGALTEGLSGAIGAGSAAMAEHLLAQGAALTKDAAKVLAAADRGAETPVIGVLEKWAARERDIPLPSLRSSIDALPVEKLFESADSIENLAGGANSIAMRAAYAGKFLPVMQQAASGGNFDPAILIQTKDAYGNSVLDVLGAHGKLNDILVAEAWKDRDAVAFIRDNAPPCYQAQCDFNGLKAGLDQLRLKDLGRRARIGLKGPLRD